MIDTYMLMIEHKTYLLEYFDFAFAVRYAEQPHLAQLLSTAGDDGFGGTVWNGLEGYVLSLEFVES